MSRESAYRLHARDSDGLFAALWDRIFASEPCAAGESHIGALSNGRLMRLLGNHFRRKCGDFTAIGVGKARAFETSSDGTFVTQS